MRAKLTKEELVRLVKRIIDCEGSEAEIDRSLQVFQQNVPHPEAAALIYYSTERLTPEEIVERALAYRPILLPSGDITEES